MSINNVKVDLWFPDNSNFTNTEFEVSYDELMLMLATNEIYLTEFKDEDEPVPHYKIYNSIFQTDEEETKVILWLDYADHNIEAKRKKATQ